MTSKNLTKLKTTTEYSFTENNIYKQELTFIQEYQNCINREAETLASTPIQHPIRIAGIYSYLLKKGFLSYNHKFHTNDTDRDVDLDFNSGIEIVCGNGICRHISSNFNDILKLLNIPSSTLAVSITDIATEVAPELGKKKISTNIDDYKTISKDYHQLSLYITDAIDRLSPNHVINIMTYLDKAYYIDLLNNFFFNKKDYKHLELCNAKQLKQLGYPKKDYTLPIYFYDSEYSLEEIKVILYILKNKTACPEEIITEFYLGKLYAKENQQKFDTLYKANKKSYKIIKNSLSEYEKKYKTKRLTKE